MLERSQHLDTIVLDKTGTVTTGELSVADVWSAPGEDPDRVLALAASAEAGSEHPVALAIVAAAHERGLELAHAAEFRSTPGRGVRALLDGVGVWVGRPSSPENSPQLASVLEDWEASGRTAVVIEDLGSTNGTYLNDQPLSGPQPLHEGDRIRIGDSEFSYLQ